MEISKGERNKERKRKRKKGVIFKKKALKFRPEFFLKSFNDKLCLHNRFLYNEMMSKSS